MRNRKPGLARQRDAYEKKERFQGEKTFGLGGPLCTVTVHSVPRLKNSCFVRRMQLELSKAYYGRLKKATGPLTRCVQCLLLEEGRKG